MDEKRKNQQKQDLRAKPSTTRSKELKFAVHLADESLMNIYVRRLPNLAEETQQTTINDVLKAEVKRLNDAHGASMSFVPVGASPSISVVYKSLMDTGELTSNAHYGQGSN